MKKRYVFIFAILIAILITAGFAYSACTDITVKKEEEYFYKINTLLRDMDFYTAKTTDNTIELYDSENTLTDTIAFDDYDKSISLVYIRKEGSVIYFITSAAVDDEWGVMYINDDSNNILDGVKSIKRIGGNSYQYSTM